jgi:predicted MFS family arabinose efflux permease
MELGIGIGAFVSGSLYSNAHENLFATFLVCSVLALLAFGIVILHRATQKIVA